MSFYLNALGVVCAALFAFSVVSVQPLAGQGGPPGQAPGAGRGQGQGRGQAPGGPGGPGGVRSPWARAMLAEASVARMDPPTLKLRRDRGR